MFVTKFFPQLLAPFSDNSHYFRRSDSQLLSTNLLFSKTIYTFWDLSSNLIVSVLLNFFSIFFILFISIFFRLILASIKRILMIFFLHPRRVKNILKQISDGIIEIVEVSPCLFLLLTISMLCCLVIGQQYHFVEDSHDEVVVISILLVLPFYVRIVNEVIVHIFVVVDFFYETV